MQQHWQGMQQTERDGMLIVVDRTHCDLDPAEVFDDSVWDIKEIYEKINAGIYEWFDLRVRVLVEGFEVGCAYAGGFLYENPDEVLTDGIVNDLTDEAVTEAQGKFYQLGRKFTALAQQVDN